jgi:hypothetical protein
MDSRHRITIQISRKALPKECLFLQVIGRRDYFLTGFGAGAGAGFGAGAGACFGAGAGAGFLNSGFFSMVESSFLSSFHSASRAGWGVEGGDDITPLLYAILRGVQGLYELFEQHLRFFFFLYDNLYFGAEEFILGCL